MSLIVTILLMFINNYSYVRQVTPLVSKISCLDGWCMGCILFVTVALLEYAIIIHIRFKSTEHEEQVKARCQKLDIVAALVSICLYLTFISIRANHPDLKYYWRGSWADGAQQMDSPYPWCDSELL